MKEPVWLIFLVFCFSCHEEPKLLNLRFRPEPGKTWSVKTQTINSSVANSGTFSDTVFFDFDLSLVKADSAGDRLSMRVTKLRVVRPPVARSVVPENGAKSISMDMAGFVADRNKVYEAVENDTLLLVMSNAGVLIMEDGYDRVAEKLVVKTGQGTAAVRSAIRDYLGSAALNDFFKGLFFYLPADDIEHRPSWVSNTVFTSMAPVKHSNMIKVDSLGIGQVFLEVEAQVSAGEEGSRYRTGTKKGTVTVDKSTGVVLALRLDEESTINAPGAERRIIKNTILSGRLQ